MTIETERAVQNRVIELLRKEFGFEYWGNLRDFENTNLNERVLRNFLVEKQKLTDSQAAGVVRKLKVASLCTSFDDLYNANKAVYQMLRYPVQVETEPGMTSKQVMLIDWDHPYDNVFGISEEVTVRKLVATSEHRRPDIVISVNGIALGVLELKKANVSVADGIRQNWRNQQNGEIPHFFATTQLLMAGSESEGLKYATTRTPEKYWLTWKEPCGSPCAEPKFGPKRIKNLLDRSVVQFLDPERFLSLIHDGTVFDAGVKKVMRPAQYFCLEAAKPRIMRKESGIIWHSQGSGKSLSMVWLAQWIKDHRTDARVVIITDRDELDQQITNGFKDVGEAPHRATSGQDLIAVLNDSKVRLITTLIHKFGVAGDSPTSREERIKLKRSPELYLKQVADRLPAGFKAKGDVFVFVDECHRTQGGILNKAMKKIMGENVMLIGFTGTPLLKDEKETLTSQANFGSFIHTYKFDEAVKDGVVLDLRYEARDVEQNLSDEVTVDRIFEEATTPLTPKAREDLKARWAQLQQIFSSRDRLTRIATDICKDFALKKPLKEGWGNAMLVCESVYQAYRYWEMFERVGSPLRGYTAVVTSYDGHEPELSEGYTGELATEAEYKHKISKWMFGDRTPEEFEAWAKEMFVESPGMMKLLIVVDKLLTGFDAPPATYLYIDKKMEDHNLFQAICRVNRLNGENKNYGYIVDYKHLFENIKGAVEDYTNGAFKNYSPEDVTGLLKDRLVQGRKELEEALEACDELCADVKPPKTLDEFFDYFCWDEKTTPVEEQQEELARNERIRGDFYKAVSKVVRCYSEIALEMSDAGFDPDEAVKVRQRVNDYDQIRQAVQKRCGDWVDFKSYDAAMRALLDGYVIAKNAEKLGDLGNLSFLDLVAKKGVESPEVAAAQSGVGGERAVAETMASEVRSYIVRKRETNPAEYRKFSERINRLLEDYARDKTAYKKLLEDLVKLAEEIRADRNIVDPRLDTEAKRSLYDNLGGDADLAIKVWTAVMENAKPGFRTNTMRRRKVEIAIAAALAGTDYKLQDIYSIIEHQEEFE